MKKSIILILSWSLCFYPVGLSSQNTGSGHWVNTLNNIIDQTGQMVMGGQNTAQNIMARSVPQTDLPLPFQGCLVISAPPPIPPPQRCEQGLHPQDPNTPQAIAHYQSNQFNANGMVTFLEDILSEVEHESDGPGHTGIKCLKDRMDLEKQKFQNILNYLTTTVDEIKRKNEMFKQELANSDRQMEDIHALLNGNNSISGQRNANKQERSLADLFSSQKCQKLLTKQTLDNATQTGGLLGLRSNFTDHYDKATAYDNQQDQLKELFNNQVRNISNNIRDYGIDGWIENLSSQNNNLSEYQNIGNMQALIQDKAQQFTLRRNALQGELEKMGISSLPRMDLNFSNKFGRYRNTFKRKAKSNYIDQCVLGERSNGSFGSLDAIISGLRQRGTASKGNVSTFKSQLQSILREHGLIEYKMSEIQSLVKEYGEEAIVVDFLKDGRRTSGNIYSVLQHNIANCDIQYETEDQGGGQTMQQMDREVDSLLGQYQRLASDLSSDITQSLREEVLRCENRVVTTESCLQAGAMSSSGPSFCFNKANQCSSEIKSCHSQIDNLVKDNTMKLNTIADFNNKKRIQLISEQNAVLNELKKHITTYGGMINAIVPGALFDFPEEIFLKTPEMAESKFGVLLVGGDNIESIFKELPQKIESLTNELKGQNNLMMNELKNGIDKQVNNIRRNMGKALTEWQAIASSCGEKLQQFQVQMAEIQRQQMEQYQQWQEKAHAACQRYLDAQGMSMGPLCDNGIVEELYKESFEISFMINPDMKDNINQARIDCLQRENERDWGLENEDQIAGDLFQDCLSNPDDTSESRRQGERQNSLIQRLSSSKGEDAREKIEDFFEMDFAQINRVFNEYKQECQKDDIPNEHTIFCDNLKNNILPTLNGNNINKDNYNNIKNELRRINNYSPNQRPTISSGPTITLPTEQEENLKRKAEQALSSVFESTQENFCNHLATEAIMDVLRDCEGDNQAARCFNDKLERYKNEGNSQIKNIARALDTSRNGTLFGEEDASEISCSTLHYGERNEDPIPSEPSTIEEFLDQNTFIRN